MGEETAGGQTASSCPLLIGLYELQHRQKKEERHVEEMMIASDQYIESLELFLS